MSVDNIRKAILSLKMKNSEGYDRIPQRILLDGISELTIPFTKLFNLIYSTNLTTKSNTLGSMTLLIHSRSNVNNYYYNNSLTMN